MLERENYYQTNLERYTKQLRDANMRIIRYDAITSLPIKYYKDNKNVFRCYYYFDSYKQLWEANETEKTWPEIMKLFNSANEGISNCLSALYEKKEDSLKLFRSHFSCANNKIQYSLKCEAKDKYEAYKYFYSQIDRIKEIVDLTFDELKYNPLIKDSITFKVIEEEIVNNIKIVKNNNKYINVYDNDEFNY